MTRFPLNCERVLYELMDPIFQGGFPPIAPPLVDYLGERPAGCLARQKWIGLHFESYPVSLVKIFLDQGLEDLRICDLGIVEHAFQDARLSLWRHIVL